MKYIEDKKTFSIQHSLQIKGIAIIFMMFHHCFCNANRWGSHVIQFAPFTQQFVVDISAMLKICVSLFAFLSGFGLILNYEKNEDKTWASSRIFKLLTGFWPIFLIFLTLSFLVDHRVYAVYFKKGTVFGVVQILIDFFGLAHLFDTATLCGTWWYMSLAILFVASIPLISKALNEWGVTVTLLLTMALPRIIGWQYEGSSFINFFTPFLLGAIFSKYHLFEHLIQFYKQPKTTVAKIFYFMFSTAVMIVAIYLYFCVPASKLWEYRYGIYPVLLICYAYVYVLDFPWIKQVLVYLGKHSMNIYLAHTFIRVYYMYDFIYSLGHFVVIAGVLLALSIVLSIAIEYLKRLCKYDQVVKFIAKEMGL